jgi:hypothetical protein
MVGSRVWCQRCFVLCGQGWPFQRSVRLMLLPPLPYPIAGFTYCSAPLTPTASPADGVDGTDGQAPLPPDHSFLLSGEVYRPTTAHDRSSSF